MWEDKPRRLHLHTTRSLCRACTCLKALFFPRCAVRPVKRIRRPGKPPESPGSNRSDDEFLESVCKVRTSSHSIQKRCDAFTRGCAPPREYSCAGLKELYKLIFTDQSRNLKIEWFQHRAPSGQAGTSTGKFCCPLVKRRLGCSWRYTEKLLRHRFFYEFTIEG